MSRTDLKNKIHERGSQNVRIVVNDFQERIDDLKAVTINNDDAESASQSEARRDSDIELMDTLADQLDFSVKELETMKSMDLNGADHDKVTFGSVVHTDNRNFFIGVSIDNFEVEGRDYVGISPRAPLYKELEGSKVGDKVTFNGMSYKVEEVF